MYKKVIIIWNECPISDVFRELQIKEISLHNSQNIEKCKKKKKKITPNASTGMEQQELTFISGGTQKAVLPVWETLWWFLTQLTIPLPYELAILLLGIYPEELKTDVPTKTAHGCLQHLYLQLPKLGHNEDVLQLVWGDTRCGPSWRWIIQQ